MKAIENDHNSSKKKLNRTEKRKFKKKSDSFSHLNYFKELCVKI